MENILVRLRDAETTLDVQQRPHMHNDKEEHVARLYSVYTTSLT